MLRLSLFLVASMLSFGPNATASNALILNEVLYDPAGSDAGSEFIELLNCGAAELSLAGFELQFVNGTEPAEPRTLWRGGADIRVLPGQRWLIAESAVTERDELVTLGLQNGPDALWLLRDGVRVDALAWGDVLGLGEGSPALDVSNQSLARVPDGIDTGDNALDWTAAAPTPGAPNSFDNWLRPIELRLDPIWRAQAGPQHAHLRLVAAGDAPLQRASLDWRLDAQSLSLQEISLARGDTLSARTQFEASLGAHRLVVHVRAEAATVDSLVQPLRVGSGAARLNELMPRPNSGDAEWIELVLLDPEFCAGAGYSVFDASAEGRAWEAEDELCADRFVLLASDCERLRSTSPLPAGVPCFPLLGGWLALNDRGSADAPADVVGLIDNSGAVIDWVAYGQNVELPRGRSLERALGGAEAGWLLSPTEPTPGRVNATATAELPENGLRVSPNPFRAGGVLLHVVLRAQPGWRSAKAEIRDLRGRLVRVLSGADSGELRQWVWDGQDQSGRGVEPGAYVVWVEVEQVNAPALQLRQLLAVGVAR